MSLVKNELLIKKRIIDDVFDYDGLDPDRVKIYSYFDNRFRSLFTSYASVYDLNNCAFYINNDTFCNAFAQKTNGYNIIGITIGYPILMESKFDQRYFSKVFLVALLNEASISEAYCNLYEDDEFQFNEFMLNCSIQYTFSHEFRHILQLNSSQIASNFKHRENLSRTKFSLKNHAWEFDADRIASFEVLKYIFSVNRELKRRSDEKLLCMMYLGLASMIITKSLFYYGVIHQSPPKFTVDKQGFYTKKYSHPHPLVRIYNISEYFYENVRADFPRLKIDSQQLLNNALGIMKLYFDALIPDQNIIQGYFDDSINYLDEINEYNQELYDFAVKDKSIRTLLKAQGIKFE